MAASIDLPISKVTSTITLRVTGLNWFARRLRLAQLFFRFGAWIAGVGIIFETTKQGDEWRTYRSGSVVDQVNEELRDGKKLHL